MEITARIIYSFFAAATKSDGIIYSLETKCMREHTHTHTHTQGRYTHIHMQSQRRAEAIRTRVLAICVFSRAAEKAYDTPAYNILSASNAWPENGTGIRNHLPDESRYAAAICCANRIYVLFVERQLVNLRYSNKFIFACRWMSGQRGAGGRASGKLRY